MMKIVRNVHVWECSRKDDEDVDEFEKYGLSKVVIGKSVVLNSKME